MPILDDSHDFAHPVEGDSAWSESYYFNAYDPGTDTGFFTRIGVRPNEGTMDVGLTIWRPGGGVASVRSVREQREMTDSDLVVGGIRYERVVPGKEWRLTADATSTAGPVALDVTFRALTPLIGGDGQGKEGSGASASTRGTVGKGHLEQAGGWTGRLDIDGTRYDWEGSECRGNRDKSWGPRRWGGPKMWRWFSINIGDDVHAGGIRIGTESGDLHRGWIWRDGAHSSIREWKVTSDLEDDGVTHRATYVLATDAEGRTHELNATLMRVEPGRAGVRPNATIVNEGLARWEYEGATGYGISEYLHQLDADARPVVPIE